jgi:hypothetical protein
MSEPVKALEHLDHLVPTDLWGDIEHRRPGREPEPPVSDLRRAAVIAAALAIAVVAIAIPIGIVTRDRPSNAGRTTSPDAGQVPVLNQYVNPMGIQITLDYPATWHAQSVSQTMLPDGTGGKQVGVVISNTAAAMPSVDPSMPSPGPLPNDPQLPPDFVTLTILSSEAQTDQLAPDSPLPLSMGDAKVAPGPANIRSLNVQVAGRSMVISVQSGPKASPTDLALADAIVASIRPTDSSSRD